MNLNSPGRETALGIMLFFAATSALSQQPAGARQVFDGAMLPGVEVITFEHSDTLFPVNRVPRGGTVRPLPPAAKQLQNVHFQSRGADYDLFDYLADNRVAGLLSPREVAAKAYCRNRQRHVHPFHNQPPQIGSLIGLREIWQNCRFPERRRA